MSLLQIRGLPDDVHRALKARAADRGESLNRFLIDLLNREVARPTAAEVFDRAARRSERAGASALEALNQERQEREEGWEEIPMRSLAR